MSRLERLAKRITPALLLLLALTSTLILSIAPTFAATATGLDDPPGNDHCPAPTRITTTPFDDTVNTGAAGEDDADPTPSCTDVVSHTVWYRFTPPRNGNVIISTAGSDYSAAVAVFTGTCPDAITSDFMEVACAGDEPLAFSVRGGTTYRIMVTALNRDGGGLKFALYFSSLNDHCSTATEVATTPFSDTVDTTANGVDDADPETCSPLNHTAWYSFSAPVDGRVSIDTRDSDYDTTVSVFTGTCPNPIDSNLVEIDCGRGGGCCGSNGQVTFSARRGTTYRIMVTGNFDEPGLLVLDLRFSPTTTTTTTTRPTTTRPSPTTTSTTTRLSTTTESTVTATTVTTSTTLELPVQAREVCGNCTDDNLNGQTDYFEDDACCAEIGNLEVTEGRVKFGRGRVSTAYLNLTATLSRDLLSEVDPLVEDTGIQVRTAGGELICATMRHEHWRQRRRALIFRNPFANSAEGVTWGSLKPTRGGAVAFKIRVRFDAIRLSGLDLIATVHVGARCAGGEVNLRRARNGRLLFP